MKMKKILLAGLVVTLITAGTLFAEAPQNQEGSRERLRNALRIRQEMRQIEKTAIDSDAELKAITEDIKELHQQMQEKLEIKLRNNKEYQGKKKELEAMKEEWKNKRPGPGPQPGTPIAPRLWKK
ncbi:MAG: hypothetical protein JW957_01355 [Candidatus Omnitrophica bacterium]|nr:hypothetical protein [Candidatus Omnitrophota bacterium]